LKREVKATVSKNRITMIWCSAVWAVTFSCGACCTTESKPMFDKYLRKVLNNQVDGVSNFKKLMPMIPDKGAVYDFVFDAETLSWKSRENNSSYDI
jgi:hypothetical protein